MGRKASKPRPYKRPPEKHTPESRKIGGKKFNLLSAHKTKKDAQNAAGRMRNAGFYARVVKAPNGKYGVYSGKKKPVSNRQTGKSNKSRDSKRTALPPGKRRSKFNQMTYYERRKNRSDISKSKKL